MAMGGFRNNSKRTKGISDFQSKKRVNPTPLGPDLTEEQRKQIYIPKGPYRPGFASRGGTPAAHNYVPQPPSTKIVGDRITVIDFGPSFAEEFIASIPADASLTVRKTYWEQGLLDAYFALYGSRWRNWPAIIPWLPIEQLSSTAKFYGCPEKWGWESRMDFLATYRLDWTLEDLKNLIDWYPEYQVNHDTQYIFAGNKPFEEVQAVSKALRLPSRTDLDSLTANALMIGT